MSGFDIAVILIICFFAIIGWVRGFSWQLMGVLTIVLGFTVAYPLSGWLEPQMAGWLGFSVADDDLKELAAADQRDLHYLARGASWAFAFALIWLFTHVLYYFFREAIERWHMEELNRTLGGIFGLIKGMLVVCAMTLVLVILGVQRTRQSDTTVRVTVPTLLYGSHFAPHITRTMRAARFVLPTAFAGGMTEYLDALGELDPTTHSAPVTDADSSEAPAATPEAPAKPPTDDGEAGGETPDTPPDTGADEAPDDSGGDASGDGGG